MRRVSEKSYYSVYKEPISIQKEVLTNGEGFGDLVSMFSRISDVAKSVSPIVKAAGESGLAVKNIADAVRAVKDAKGINVSMDILQKMTENSNISKKINLPLINKFKTQMELGKGLKKF